jgi:hypothetical protein
MTCYCIYPREPELRDFPRLVEDLPSGRVSLSKAGSAELRLSGEDRATLLAAFDWAKRNVPNAAKSGLVCHAFASGRSLRNGDPIARVMRLWGCDVTSEVIDNKTVMVTGVYAPLSE